MALVQPIPTTSFNQSRTTSLYEDYSSEDDHHTGSSIRENVTAIQPRSQCCGQPSGEVAPPTEHISVDKSRDVQIGARNIYNGPVTIKQVMYPNGNPSAETSSVNSNKLEFKGDNDRDSVTSEDIELKDSSRGTFVTVESQETESQEFKAKKDFKWLPVSRSGLVKIVISVVAVVLFITLLGIGLLLSDIASDSQQDNFSMISRTEWVAETPTGKTTPLVTPVQYVIIHHTGTSNCSSQTECAARVRQIQAYHINTQGWIDIGYNFLVGGDGAAYEGRGWTVHGAHTLNYNSRSIGIAFIGDFTENLPPEVQLVVCKKLINQGVKTGYIKTDYKLLAARQVSNTESPGLALFEEIQKWPQWVKEP